jgi:integrase
LIQYVQATRKLGDTPLIVAVDSFSRSGQGKSAPITVREAKERLLKDREAKGLDSYLRDLRVHLTRMEKAFRCSIGSITPDQISQYLDDLKVGVRSRDNHRRTIATLFNFCRKQGLIPRGHLGVGDNGRRLNAGKEVTKYSPEEMEAILKAAPKGLLPALAIGGFAGLRTAEIARLDWSDVRLAKRQIEVRASNSKTKTRRLVPVSENLAVWLEPFQQAEAPAAGQAPQTTTSYFDNLGRAWRVVQPDGASVTNEYHLTGELKKTSGARTYPVEYTHDHAGRMATMTTWQDFANDSGKATTSWSYDSLRGWLDQKLYDDGKGPAYTYHPSGKLHTRTWARLVGGQALTTTYLYNNAGQLQSTDYSDSTPDLSYTHDRRGRQEVITLAGITTSN